MGDVYESRTRSIFRINNEDGMCTKIHPDGTEKSFSSYALIPMTRFEDAKREYTSMLEQKATDEASLKHLLKKLKDEGYNGEKGIMLYLYGEKGAYKIKREIVERVIIQEDSEKPSDDMNETPKSNDTISFKELGIEESDDSNP